MKRIKRVTAGILLLGILTCLCGCRPVVSDVPESLTIYATYFPIYALTEMIVKDVPDVELKCLVQPQDGCIRNYQISDWDIYMLSYAADGVIAGGRGLESFETLLQASSENQFALAEVLQGIELYEGKSEGEDSHFSGDNPHLYMSVEGARLIAENIKDALSLMDPKYSSVYEEKLGELLEELNRLQSDIDEQTAVCLNRNAAVLNEALVYSALDYGMNVVTLIERESGEHFYEDDLQSCLSQLQNSDAEVVLIEKQAPKMLVEALRDAGFRVAVMDVMSTHVQSDGFEGYCNALLDNACAIAEALTGENGE